MADNKQILKEESGQQTNRQMKRRMMGKRLTERIIINGVVGATSGQARVMFDNMKECNAQVQTRIPDRGNSNSK